jgi:hypothetical protein
MRGPVSAQLGIREGLLPKSISALLFFSYPIELKAFSLLGDQTMLP